MDVVNNRRATFKKILNVTSGNFLEQYDFFLFGFYATYIAANTVNVIIKETYSLSEWKN
ncbi:hypothetical protein, partial [Acinetobacter baumannii]|uniref:hypothetical protein n=1 Tax=Acinetobacter baumannii TaxID=470 RepID=UPI00148BED55